MKFPFLFKSSENPSAASPSPWPWPACVNTPKTLSFRANTNTNIYNSSYLDRDQNCAAESAGTPDSYFSIRDSIERDEIFASEPPEEAVTEETAVVSGLRSDRLFFEPGESNSILEEAKPNSFPYKESAKIMAIDSTDPFADFRASMDEMVAAHGLKDWQCLEELLTCYLRVNGRSNHGYIVGAFVDLLINLALASSNSLTDSSNSPTESSNSAIDEHCSSSSTATQCSFTSPLSFSSSSTFSSTSPCLSVLENEDDVVLGKKR